MKRNIYCLMVLALFLVSCGEQQKRQRQTKIKTMETLKVPTQDVTIYQTYPTNMEGIVNVAVRAKIAGYITDVLVDVGQRVSKGQLLFKLETQTLTGQAQAAKANINVAEVQVEQLKPLVEKGIVSPTKLASAKAKVKQAKSQYRSIKANIGYSEIRSPIDGLVGMIQYRRGNLVSPSNPQPITTVSNISKVYAYFSMNEGDYLDFIKKVEGKTRKEKIKNMPKVNLIMANGEIYPQDGTIQTINSQVSQQTGSITFRAVFENPKGILSNGSTGQIKIPKSYENVVVVPQVSTFERQNKTFVVLVKRNGDTTKTTTGIIDVKGRTGNIYIVESGLQEGDEIVARNVAKIANGTVIQPAVVPFDSIAEPLPVIFIK